VDRLDALRLAVAALRVEYQGKALPPLTVSVGLASAPQHTVNGSELVSKADEALYLAKNQGRNRVVMATST